MKVLISATNTFHAPGPAAKTLCGLDTSGMRQAEKVIARSDKANRPCRRCWAQVKDGQQ